VESRGLTLHHMLQERVCNFIIIIIFFETTQEDCAFVLIEGECYKEHKVYKGHGRAKSYRTYIHGTTRGIECAGSQLKPKRPPHRTLLSRPRRGSGASPGRCERSAHAILPKSLAWLGTSQFWPGHPPRRRATQAKMGATPRGGSRHPGAALQHQTCRQP
jgi:hypothetical protein